MKSLLIHLSLSLSLLSLYFAIVLFIVLRERKEKQPQKITPVIVDRYDFCQSLHEPNIGKERKIRRFTNLHIFGKIFVEKNNHSDCINHF
jgi:hypothetical protein